ncbi:MAG: oxidation resistance protein 1 [Thelocarpon impressellum]|nr:MAG: oxidation resistance protein 1 [Thelocarpon impressellum]
MTSTTPSHPTSHPNPLSHPAYSSASASTSTSATSTPPRSSSPAPSYFPSSLTGSVTSLLRRISTPTQPGHHSFVSEPPPPTPPAASSDASSLFYNPPQRKASPFQPPPLTPLSLRDVKPGTTQILTRALAEEIRLLIPPRLQLEETWRLAYSVEQDGVSLGTLYQKCEALKGVRRGYVLVVRDGGGGVFGAYLSDPPSPSPHYYGTGECFLWRSSVLSSIPLLSSLPPPPSADTTIMQRSTTIGGKGLAPAQPGTSGTSTPEQRIRFKAFPYSGINDYLVFCEHSFLSVGGGDGHYGLWLDDVFEHGISASCPTFGNEPLSDEGKNFDVLGVEMWCVGHA